MRVTSELALEPRFGVGRGDSSRRGDAVEVGPQAKLSQRASGAAPRASGAPIRAARSARFAPNSPSFFEAKPPTALEAAQKVWRDYLEAERSGRTEKAAWPSRRRDIEEVRLVGLQRAARLWIFCLLMCSPFVLCLRYYETRTYKGLRGGVRRVPVERSTAAPAAVEVSSEARSFTEDVAVTGAPSRAEAASISQGLAGAHGTSPDSFNPAQSAAEAGVLAKDRVVTTAPRAALAALWRRVRDGVKRVAKRPRQSESSITTRSRGKRHKTSGTTREKRARDDGDEDRALHKKRRADDAFTVVADEAMLEGDDKPTASPTTSAPTVSPQPTLEPTVTSAPSASPQPTVTQKPTSWLRACNNGERRDEQCEPEEDQLDGYVNRTEGPMLISCDFRPDATLEEKESAFQALVDKGSWVVATGVAYPRQQLHVRRNHYPPSQVNPQVSPSGQIGIPQNFFHILNRPDVGAAARFGARIVSRCLRYKDSRMVALRPRYRALEAPPVHQN